MPNANKKFKSAIDAIVWNAVKEPDDELSQDAYDAVHGLVEVRDALRGTEYEELLTQAIMVCEAVGRCAAE